MKKITLALFVAGTLLALTSGANAADEMTEKMLESLTGQWCQISGTSIHGEYRKAKNYCREDRPVSFIVHNPGFWIKLRNVKTKIICIPQGVEPFALGRIWDVDAICGAENNSTPVYRLSFTFEKQANGNMMITKSTVTQ
jgi:hypothetical protein